MKDKKLIFKKENLTKLNKEDLKKVTGGYIEPHTGSVCTTKSCGVPKYVC
ncbi:MAG: class I lanthipeptide [Tannerellaceae bacterium]|nr:class I lanthipeptide [Tannerellaceae bacterium]